MELQSGVDQDDAAGEEAAGELARGELVVACDKPLRGLRSYYLVSPEQGDERALLTRFRAWLLAQAAQSALG